MQTGDSILDKLRRVHAETVTRFPHDFLDVGLGAVGLFLHDTPKNAGYRPTPLNSVAFASTGVDGVHFSSVTEGSSVDENAPVVVTIPMETETPNYIVGDSLRDFLALGICCGYAELINLSRSVVDTLKTYEDLTAPYDDREGKILKHLADELGLSRWADIPRHFNELQERFMHTLVIPDRNSKP